MGHIWVATRWLEGIRLVLQLITFILIVVAIICQFSALRIIRELNGLSRERFETYQLQLNMIEERLNKLERR